MAKLQQLWLCKCNLHGTLPMSWGTGFPSLLELYLRYNDIEGGALTLLPDLSPTQHAPADCKDPHMKCVYCCTSERY